MTFFNLFFLDGHPDIRKKVFSLKRAGVCINFDFGENWMKKMRFRIKKTALF
jgi:hypothetical protein